MKALFNFAFQFSHMIAKFGWLDLCFNSNVNPFVFILCMGDHWCHHCTEPLVSTYTLTPRWIDTSLCLFRSGGVNGYCLQCLKFPNRPLNDFRDAIFKAYIVNLGFSCCLNMKKIFDCIFNGTFWVTFCKKQKTSKKSRERLPGCGERGRAEMCCVQ